MYGADQTAQMCRLICAFVVCIWQKQVFSCRGSFDVWTSYFGIISQYDPTFDLKIHVGHCDLYFIVQWFWHILKTIWCKNTYFGIMSQYDMTFDFKINVGHCDLYLKTIQWLNIILWHYEPLWPDIWPQNIWRSLWPKFHGPLNLNYILKTAWCMNIIVTTLW